ncbi:hypothetical protein MTR_0144s0020 [Medicago truncatula]|uniref:Uncharacterized protein n=1 Tax=Medicago truncatula TaxID=3880 RepID=A0A072TI25_MEDTR|nr:hypothetical protein MTR_0144s0020 [Medicago truncatula]
MCSEDRLRAWKQFMEYFMDFNVRRDFDSMIEDIDVMLDVTFEKETYVDQTTFLCVSQDCHSLLLLIMTDPRKSFSGWFLFATNTTIDLDMFVEIRV